MRRLLSGAFLSLAAACGGGAAVSAGPSSQTASRAEDTDPGFSEYAAAHGIATLDHPEKAPEVSADGLRLEALDRARPVKLDGVLAEWPAPVRAMFTARGSPKVTLAAGLQYDDVRLYVGADVTDPSFAVGKDHVSLVLAVPKPRATGYEVTEIDLYAGKPGESEGSVRYGDGGRVPGAKIVEAPTDGGYSLEATIPLSAIPEMRATLVGIHGRIAYVDGDGELATGPGDARHPAAMAWVPSEPELAMIEQLLAPKGLTTIAPAADLVVDLTGDGHRERIAVFEHYLTICGGSYLNGTGFFFRDLVGELVALEVRDASGRGRGDVVLRRRQSSGDGTREYVEVLSALSNSEEPRLTFAHEIGVRQSDRHLENAVRFSRGEIEVTTQPASGWNAATYGEPIANDVEPILLPWGPVRSQIFRFDGVRFSKAKETTQRFESPSDARSGGAAAEDSGARTASEPLAERRQGPAARAAEPPTPRVTRGGDLSAELLEQYRRDRGVPASLSPRVDLQVHVTGDERPERVLLIGRDIVVFGPGFKGGTGYAFLTLQPFADPGDVQDLTARDLTGDGAADLVVRGVRRVASGKTRMEVEMMLVYGVGDDGISRIFAIETARTQKGKRVQGLVQFVPNGGGRGFDILAAPGRATGWTAHNCPFSQDQPGDGNIEPLLLPWGGISSVRYTWNGSQFVRSGG